jgi:carbon storage regulator
MLVLTRKPGERTIIHDRIEITVLAVKGDRVVLGFEADASIPIMRSELAERIEREDQAHSR